MTYSVDYNGEPLNCCAEYSGEPLIYSGCYTGERLTSVEDTVDIRFNIRCGIVQL